MLKWIALEIGVERRRVILCAEFFSVLEPFVLAEFLAGVAVKADVMPEVVTLEDAMVLHHPMVRWRDKRFQDACSDLWVVERGEGVTDVMQQCTHDVLIVSAVLFRTRRCLKTVLEAVHRKASEIMSEVPQVLDDPVGNLGLGVLKTHHDVVAPCGLRLSRTSDRSADDEHTVVLVLHLDDSSDVGMRVNPLGFGLEHAHTPVR